MQFIIRSKLDASDLNPHTWNNITLNNVFRKHAISRFRAHVRAAFIYLDNVSAKLTRMKESLASNNSEEIIAGARDLVALQKEAALLNGETEELMNRHNVSDEEINFRYRER